MFRLNSGSGLISYLTALAMIIWLFPANGLAQGAKRPATPAASKRSAAPSKKPAGASPAAAVKPASQAEATPAEEAPAPEPVKSSTLGDAVKAYRERPDDISWQEVWKSLTQLLRQPAAIKTGAAVLIANNPSLHDLGVKLIDCEGGRLWTFPRVPECQSVIVQWQGSVATTVERTVRRRGRNRVIKQVSYTPVSRAQVLNVPKTVTLTDAHLVQGYAAAPAAPAKRGGKPEVKRAAAPTSARYLVLAGQQPSGAVFLQGFKLSGEGFVESPDLFSALPPFLTQNITGKAGFSGNDLVFDVTGKDGETRPSAAVKGKPAPSSSGYRIVLKLVGGHYTLGGKSAEDAPAVVAGEFMQAVQQGRADVAKGWLIDPNLISITKYVGLLGHSQPCKLIAMANPGGGVSRFRVITFQKNDLILDVGRVKKQLAVKALFIAPPDPLAQKLAGSFAASVSADADKNKEKEKDDKGDESQSNADSKPAAPLK